MIKYVERIFSLIGNRIPIAQTTDGFACLPSPFKIIHKSMFSPLDQIFTY